MFNWPRTSDITKLIIFLLATESEKPPPSIMKKKGNSKVRKPCSSSRHNVSKQRYSKRHVLWCKKHCATFYRQYYSKYYRGKLLYYKKYYQRYYNELYKAKYIAYSKKYNKVRCNSNYRRFKKNHKIHQKKGSRQYRKH